MDIGSVDIFVGYVRLVAAEWTRAKYVAPYIVAFQSGGVGKTRLLFANAFKYGLTIHICCRHKMPPRSAIADIMRPTKD